MGIDLDNVMQELLVEGVEKFAQPYDGLIEKITEKKADTIAT